MTKGGQMALERGYAAGMPTSALRKLREAGRQHMPSEQQEQELIAMVLSGESLRFQELIEPYAERLYRMALSMVRNPADAEDIVQESYLKAFLNLVKFRSDSRFSTWLTSIALNEARALMRARRYIAYEPLDTCCELEGAFFVEVICKRPLPIDVIEQSELRGVLARAVQGLHPTYREIYDLREIEEVSTESAAERLGIPVPVAKTRLHRARKMLRQRVAVLMGISLDSAAGARSEVLA